MKEIIKNWWANLAEREQLMLSWGSLFVVLIMLYLLIWQPVIDKKNALYHNIQSAQALKQRLETNAGSIAILRQTAASNSYASANAFLPILERTLNEANIGANSLNPINNNEIRAQFNNVPFNLLILWLHQLQLNQGIGIKQATFTKNQEEGKVSAQIDITL